MKKNILFACVMSLNLFFYQNTHAQCTPDNSCNDIDNPGEVCPSVLPSAIVNEPYNQVVTIIPPSSFTYNGQTQSLSKIKVSNIENIPPGITYECNPNNCEFVVTDPFTRYCILVSGTPTQVGTYPLSIHVIPYTIIYGTEVALPEQVDDTSLVLIVNNASYSQIIDAKKFTLLEPIPNPFSDVVSLNYYTPNTSNVTLQVFDVLGNKVYEEKMTADRGENKFKFDGSTLKQGIYIYTVTNGNEHYVKHFVKK